MTVNDVLHAVNKSPENKIIFPITISDIEKMDLLIDPRIKAAPYSNKVFQIMWNKNNSEMLFLNSLSCGKCLKSPPCCHYSLLSGGWHLDETKKSKSVDLKTKKAVPIKSLTRK